ncbi:MAG: TIGR00730 family Rossman fold protein [Planctomycetaceae bacterium]|nr:TIGR00730 family Rossman fold protein [Planctomycetaceae bacterium]
MNICVYCASSGRISQVYFDATERLARELVQANMFVVYGGGASGLMGKLADTVLAEGGKIRGVIPRFMDKIEWTHPGITEVVLTETMQERKMKFLDGTDALVALPGGTGTLEELLEAITLKRLGLLTIPIVILNTAGYYDPLREMFEKAIRENFMREKHRQMWTFVDEPEEVLSAIHGAAAWDKDAIRFAVP